MRFALLIAAFGIMTGAPALVPVLAPAAQAQQAELPAAEQESIDAAIDAVFADTTLTADQIQAQITAIVQNSSSPGAAARRVATKVVGLPVATQQAAGAGLMQVVTNLQSSDPAAAADIQVAVAMSASAEFQIGYVNGPTTPQNTDTTTTTPVVVQQQPRITRRPAPPPTEPVIPTVPEPNPAQAGSPV